MVRDMNKTCMFCKERITEKEEYNVITQELPKGALLFIHSKCDVKRFLDSENIKLNDTHL